MTANSLPRVVHFPWHDLTSARGACGQILDHAPADRMSLDREAVTCSRCQKTVKFLEPGIAPVDPTVTGSTVVGNLHWRPPVVQAPGRRDVVESWIGDQTEVILGDADAALAALRKWRRAGCHDSDAATASIIARTAGGRLAALAAISELVR